MNLLPAITYLTVLDKLQLTCFFINLSLVYETTVLGSFTSCGVQALHCTETEFIRLVDYGCQAVSARSRAAHQRRATPAHHMRPSLAPSPRDRHATGTRPAHRRPCRPPASRGSSCTSGSRGSRGRSTTPRGRPSTASTRGRRSTDPSPAPRAPPSLLPSPRSPTRRRASATPSWRATGLAACPSNGKGACGRVVPRAEAAAPPAPAQTSTRRRRQQMRTRRRCR